MNLILNPFPLILLLFFSFGLAFDWQDNNPDCRISAMGNVDTAIECRYSAAFSNPASLSKKSAVFSASQCKIFGEAQVIYIGYTTPTVWGQVAIGCYSLSDKGYLQTSYSGGRPIIIGNSFSYHSNAFYLANSNSFDNILNLGIDINFGVTTKVLFQQMFNDQSAGFAGDIGLKIDLFSDFISFGSVISNAFGSSIDWTNAQDEQLTSKIKYGIAIIPIDTVQIGLDYSGIGYRENAISYGAEWWIFPSIAIRGGANKKYISAGISYRWDNLELAFSYLNYTEEFLPDNYKFTLAYSVWQALKPKVKREKQVFIEIIKTGEIIYLFGLTKNGDFITLNKEKLGFHDDDLFMGKTKQKQIILSTEKFKNELSLTIKNVENKLLISGYNRTKHILVFNDHKVIQSGKEFSLEFLSRDEQNLSVKVIMK